MVARSVARALVAEVTAALLDVQIILSTIFEQPVACYTIWRDGLKRHPCDGRLDLARNGPTAGRVVVMFEHDHCRRWATIGGASCSAVLGSLGARRLQGSVSFADLSPIAGVAGLRTCEFFDFLNR